MRYTVFICIHLISRLHSLFNLEVTEYYYLYFLRLFYAKKNNFRTPLLLLICTNILKLFSAKKKKIFSATKNTPSLFGF